MPVEGTYNSHTHNRFTALWNLSGTTRVSSTRRNIHPLTLITVINYPYLRVKLEGQNASLEDTKVETKAKELSGREIKLCVMQGSFRHNACMIGLQPFLPV